MGSDTPRALVIAAAPRAFGIAPEAVAEFADGSPYVLPPPSSRPPLGRVSPDTPVHVLGDFPEWLAPSFARAFGDRAAREGEALARRAPVDVRVNTLKATREKVEGAALGAAPTPLSPVGVRLTAPEGLARTPNVEAEAGHGKGWYEVQDEGSQLAALLTGAGPRMQVADVCAGSGGKTLALAAQMHNTGQIYAYDDDRLMLRPIFDRLKRAAHATCRCCPPATRRCSPGSARASTWCSSTRPARDRHLAAPPRRQVAFEAAEPRRAPCRAARGAWPGGAARQTRRAARRHLLGPARGEHGPGRLVHDRARGVRGRACGGDVARTNRERAAPLRGRPRRRAAPTPARHGTDGFLSRASPAPVEQRLLAPISRGVAPQGV